jgi:hypothetical protein
MHDLVGKTVRFDYTNSKGIRGHIHAEVYSVDQLCINGYDLDEYRLPKSFRIDRISNISVDNNMNEISFVRSPSGILSIYINGEALPPVDKTNPKYDEIKKALLDKDVDLLRKLSQPAKLVKEYCRDKIQVKDGIVTFNGKQVANVVTHRIIEFMNEGLPFEPLMKFLEKLMRNPSYRATQALYKFIEHKGLPICDDGDFIAYKRVRDDYKDIHSGTILYNVGTTVEIERNLVDDNWETECSNGLHVGTMEYVKIYGTGGHVLMIKINPADVVSVPSDAEAQKIRVCKLQVVKEMPKEEALKESLVTGFEEEEEDEDDIEETYDDDYK